MRSTKARPQLDTLIVQLRGWETAVPERARRFHAIRTELEREIRGAIPFWSLWIGDEVVERFRDRVMRLRLIADPLANLIRDSALLEAEVRRLAEGSPSADRELAEWLRTRCRDWIALVGRLGANCEREADVFADQATYDQTETAVRQHHEALHQLVEADRVLVAIGSDVRAAGLAGLLPQFRRRLYTDGSTIQWIDELKALIQPLRPVAERIQDPPRELNEVGVILTELRGWSALLGNDEQVRRSIEQLEERRFRIADWEQGGAQELVDEAQRLRTQLLEQVQQIRDTKVRELEQGLADLRQACGDQPELDAWLAELSPRQSNRPQLFRDWLAHFEKFRHSFKAVAQAQIGTLETRLAETVARTAEKLEELERRPLSDSARIDAVFFAQNLRALRPAIEVEEILAQLRVVYDLARQVDALERRAEHELEELEQQQNDLQAKYERLQTELRRVKGIEIDVSAIALQIAALTEATAGGSLEDRRLQVLALTTALANTEADFIERCRQLLSRHVADVHRASEVLRRCNATPPTIDIPSIAPDALPGHAAEAVFGARRLHNILLRLARATRDQLEQRRKQARADIRSIRPDDLGPADRQRAEQLLRALDERPGKQTLIDALETTAALLEKCDRFFEARQQEQHSARERLADLHQRFRDFTDEQLNRFCPELSERVAALLYGIPEHPRQWSAVHHQLDRAVDLFARVRSHAQRLAADEVDRAAETLRVRLRGGGGGFGSDDVQKLLTELDGCGSDVLAPAALRQRVVNASQRRV